VLGAVAVLYAGFVAVSAWNSWNSVEREEFDTASARQRLEQRAAAAPSTTATTSTTLLTDLGYVAFDSSVVPSPSDRSVYPDPPTTTTTELPAPAPSKPQAVNAYLAIGVDTSGYADAILLLVQPPGTAPILVSIPRSLYLNNPCTDEPMRLALALSGCPGAASGTELLAIVLEDFTGLSVNHFARIKYSGFPRIVDAIGGVEICVDTARGSGGTVIIPAGCNLADGAAATWWVTNRSEDELVDGTWRALAGDGDVARTGRQRSMILTLFSRIGSFGSAGSITSVLSGVSEAFTFDGGLSLGGAANLAWSMRGQSLQQMSIPTETAYTADGRRVLYPVESFAATLSRVYPPAGAYQP
jgi:LCP family protein required for cell wall assembly